MNSSLWSINSDRSSSSLSWEEECDKDSEKYLQNLLDSIDEVVFGAGKTPDLPKHLLHESLLWRKKFSDQQSKPVSKNFDKRPMKSKALSASEVSVKSSSQQRSVSEQTFTFPKTLELIPNKPNISRERPNELNRHAMNNQKPLILPPIVNPNPPRRQSSKIPIASAVHFNVKMSTSSTASTSFPKPAPVLSLEQVLRRTHNCVNEEKSAKYSILPHIHKYNNRTLSQKSILPIIK